MKSNDLLDAFNDIQDKYILSAAKSKTKAATRRIRFSKAQLIAATVALALVLTGCAAVFIGIQQRKIGEHSTVQKFDEYGKAMTPKEVTVNVVSPQTDPEAPLRLATQEWYAFTDTYDPEHKLMENTNVHGIPDNYYFTYDCYTWDMVSKLDKIVQKHNLKLLDSFHVAQAWQAEVMFEGLGIPGLTRPGAQVDVDYSGSSFHANGNFRTDLDFTLTGADSLWERDCFARYQYAEPDYFDPTITSCVTGDFDQWNYVTADGTEVLLVLSKNGRGQIYAEQKDAIVYIDIDPGLPFIREEGDLPTRQVLEQMADIFSYTIRPTDVDMEALQPKLDAAEAAYQAQWEAYEEPVYGSYGEYLNSLDFPERKFYALEDITLDGQPELLIGWGDGSFVDSYTMENGQVKYLMAGHDEYWICEDNFVEAYNNTNPFYPHESHQFFKMPIYQEDKDCPDWVEKTDKGYFQGLPSEPITEAEFNAAISKYTRKTVEFKPVLSYPMDEEGTTLEQYISKHDPILTEADILKLYTDLALEWQAYESEFEDPTQYYDIRDINDDGILDLLLNNAMDPYCMAYTISRGKPTMLYHGCSILENGMLGFMSGYIREEGQVETFQFYSWDGLRMTPAQLVRHNLSADTWGMGEIGPEITEAEAQAILSQYSPVKIDLRPIDELK